jgi:hypothetical protein
MNDKTLIIVRCRSCSEENEIYVQDFFSKRLFNEGGTTYYRLQEGEAFGCCECGRQHDGVPVSLVCQPVAREAA